ncbi:hypothetical protein B0H16DRAFT_1738840 [Mycena metata]|uniref:Uncharacterized protein n=1 Tax=Mycena metata TaxID=1033252 RepID=A0AAD7HGR1_9AGAR|nr:hypothetical protein B0H16DRAFT_1738840 [Mycena metata]
MKPKISKAIAKHPPFFHQASSPGANYDQGDKATLRGTREDCSGAAWMAAFLAREPIHSQPPTPLKLGTPTTRMRGPFVVCAPAPSRRDLRDWGTPTIRLVRAHVALGDEEMAQSTRRHGATAAAFARPCPSHRVAGMRALTLSPPFLIAHALISSPPLPASFPRPLPSSELCLCTAAQCIRIRGARHQVPFALTRTRTQRIWMPLPFAVCARARGLAAAVVREMHPRAVLRSLFPIPSHPHPTPSFPFSVPVRTGNHTPPPVRT